MSDISLSSERLGFTEVSPPTDFFATCTVGLGAVLADLEAVVSDSAELPFNGNEDPVHSGFFLTTRPSFVTIE